MYKSDFNWQCELYMKNKLLILGAGQYACVIKEIAESIGIFEKISFLDDSHCDTDISASGKAVGKIADLPKFKDEYTHGIAAVGNADVRLRILSEIEECGLQIPALISPRSYVAASAVIGEGVVVEPLAGINANAKVMRGTYVSMGAVVNHDAIVGEGCHVDCNSVVASGAYLEPKSKVMCCDLFKK